MTSDDEHKPAENQGEQPTAQAQPAAPDLGECVLSPEHLAYIEQHASDTYPEECCGVLIGKPGRRVKVAMVRPAANRTANGKRDRYEIDPGEILHLAQIGEKLRCEIVGFYHSHPDHEPVPSASDLARAWPAYAYLIIGIDAEDSAQTRAWIYDEDTHQYYEQPIVLDPDPLGVEAGLQIVREPDR